GTFTWTYLATAAGALSIAGSVHATDSFSGTTLEAVTDPTKPAAVTVQPPAPLPPRPPSSRPAAPRPEVPGAGTRTHPRRGRATARGRRPPAGPPPPRPRSPRPAWSR